MMIPGTTGQLIFKYDNKRIHVSNESLKSDCRFFWQFFSFVNRCFHMDVVILVLGVPLLFLDR